MLIFDFDGVLADTLEVYAQVCHEVANNLGHQQPLPANPFADLDPVTFEAMGRKLGLNEEEFAIEVALAAKGQTMMPALFEGIPEVIFALSNKMPLAVLSAGNSNIIKGILTHHKIAHYFTFILGGDSGGSKTDKLIQLKKQYGDGLVMIGDSASDIDAANQAGLRSIAVTWGWQTESLLATRSPTYFASAPEQLLQIVEHLR